jgi:small conductance mechanosensitive channel
MSELEPLWSKLVAKLNGWIEELVVMTPNIAIAVLVVAASAVLGRWVYAGAYRLLSRITHNEPISRLLATVARVMVIGIALFFSLDLLHLQKTVTSLLAGVGVVGLALGFAFQDIAANFMSGVLMALHRPFRVSDLVEVGGHRGRVKELSFRATTLETLDGLSVLIPNKEIFQNAIVNYTRTPTRRLEFSLGTAYGDDMTTVRTVVIDALQDVPHRDRARDVEVLFDAFGDSSINFSVLMWLDQSDELSHRRARSEAMIAIKRALDRASLTIPFPIRTLDFGADAVGGKRLDTMKLRVAHANAG